MWHDPHMTAAGRRKEQSAQRSESDEQHRANRGRRRKGETARRAGARIVGGPTGPTDPREIEREDLLDRLLRVEGRPSITNAANAFVEAGFEFPHTQQVWLQLLEHKDEERVAQAIEQLTVIVADEPLERRAVLESRLRRIEEYADESATKEAAAGLRRMLSTAKAEPSTTPS